MRAYQELSREELLNLNDELERAFDIVKEKGLKLDMSRGKPSVAQLEMGMGLLYALDSKSCMKTQAGLDTRNYGMLDGIPEAKKLMADIMGVNPENVIVCGNASLPIMYDTISRSMTHGVLGCEPWCKQEKIKFLCPAPGYDRHFAITQHFGIEMINVPMSEDGPDMDMVEELVSSDPAIKGIWCVPKYSNPQGVVYSDETVRRMANLKPAAKDFRIYWDNAYIVHHLYGEKMGQILNIIDECEKAGNPDMVYEFASTSKVSLAGSGIAAIASSKKNLDDMKRTVTIQTIGFDKVNMLRHARYFKNAQGVLDHMEKHADILRPRFELVLETLDRELAGRGAGEWIKPKGGYFITYVTLDGCATEVIRLAKEAGVVMTGAGAPFPYHKDPHDSTIRIAPSYPSLEELKDAAEIFTVCVRYATLEKLLNA